MNESAMHLLLAGGIVSVIAIVQVPFMNIKLLHRLSLQSHKGLWMREAAQEIIAFLLLCGYL